MKDLRDPKIDALRVLRWEQTLAPGGNDAPGAQGCFRLFRAGRWLKIIAATGEGWDHVSVSAERGLPSWDDMDAIKRLFFRDDETAMQLHVPPSEHISFAEVLHLWRPQHADIPRPPGIMVAPALKAG